MARKINSTRKKKQKAYLSDSQIYALKSVWGENWYKLPDYAINMTLNGSKYPQIYSFSVETFDKERKNVQ